MYRDSEIHKGSSQELLDYTTQTNLKSSLPEVFKLLLLNISILVSVSSVQHVGCPWRIYVHKDILKELEKKGFLLNLILEKFVEKPWGLKMKKNP